MRKSRQHALLPTLRATVRKCSDGLKILQKGLSMCTAWLLRFLWVTKSNGRHLLSVDIWSIFFQDLWRNPILSASRWFQSSQRSYTLTDRGVQRYLRNMPSCQQAVFRLLILKGLTFFPPNFHLKWSPQRNLPKMTIWYITLYNNNIYDIFCWFDINNFFGPNSPPRKG